MKKYRIIVFTLLMAFLLSGCGNVAETTEPSEENTLEEKRAEEVAVFNIEYDRISGEQAELLKLIRECEELLDKGERAYDVKTKVLLEEKIAECDEAMTELTELPESSAETKTATIRMKNTSYEGYIAELKEARDNYLDSVKQEAENTEIPEEVAIRNGYYISSLLGRDIEKTTEGFGSVYRIFLEDGDLVIYGSMSYGEKDFIEDTVLQPNGMYRFPVTGSTTYSYNGGDLGPEYTDREDFVETAQKCADLSNGLALIVYIQNGTAKNVALSS